MPKTCLIRSSTVWTLRGVNSALRADLFDHAREILVRETESTRTLDCSPSWMWPNHGSGTKTRTQR